MNYTQTKITGEKAVLIQARKTNFLQYFSYFESDKLRSNLLDRIEIRQSKRRRNNSEV